MSVAMASYGRIGTRTVSDRSPPNRLVLAILMVLSITTAALAFQHIAAGVLPGGTVYSEQQIAGFFANSSNSYLAANASSFAAISHNVEDQNGNTGTYNGSCCSGLMQMNQGNLTNYCHCTPQQFAQMSGQDQVNVYTKYFEGDVQGSSGANALMQMQQNGQSLGGQPVTGAMVAACAQYGPGNCKAAVNNNCSSLANGQGGDGYLNVCSMAAKANKGPQVSNPGATDKQAQGAGPSTTTADQTTKTAASSTTPAGTGAGSTGGTGTLTVPPPGSAATTPAPSASSSGTMILGDPSFCWLCDAAVESMSVLSALATQAVPTVATEFWPLAVVLIMVGLIYRIVAQLVAGQPPLRGVASIMMRLAVVAAVLGAGTATSGSVPTASGAATMGSAGSSLPSDSTPGSTDLSPADGVTGNGSSSGDNFVTDWILSPPISLGAAIGVDLAAVAAPAVGVTAPQTANCQYTQPSSAGAAALSSATTALVGLVCYVHVAGNYGAAVGGALLSAKLGATTLVDNLAAMAFIVAGLAMVYLALSAMLSFGGALIEAIVRLGIVVAFLPFFAVMVVFDGTRHMAVRAGRALFFTFMFLVLTGAGSVVSMFIAAKSMQLGLGQTSGALDPVALSTAAQQIMTGLTVTQAASYGTLVRFLGFDLIGFMMASRILRSSQDLAAQLSLYEDGRAGQMASAPAAVVHRIGSVAMAGAGIAGVVLGRAGGRLVSGVVREATNLMGHGAVGLARRMR